MAPAWVIAGVDPGASGGFAYLTSDGEAEAWTLDTKDALALDSCLAVLPPAGRTVVGLEHVWGRGGWSSVTNFSLGGAFWVPKALCALRGLVLTEVTPHQWQLEVSRLADIPRDRDTRKRLLQDLALEQWPGFEALTSGAADALWIAHFIVRSLYPAWRRDRVEA